MREVLMALDHLANWLKQVFAELVKINLRLEEHNEREARREARETGR